MLSIKRLDKETLSQQDETMLKDWLTRDETHQSIGLQFSEFFAPDSQLMLVSDDEGPIMAVRLQIALRAAVQFNPDTRLRNTKAGKEVASWLQSVARGGKMHEVIVRAGGRAKNFVKKLGFSDFAGQVLGA